MTWTLKQLATVLGAYLPLKLVVAQRNRWKDRRMLRTGFAGLLALGLVAVTCGCASSPLVGMKLGPPTATPYEPAAGKALLLIARAVGDGHSESIIVADENGHFVASVGDMMHAVVEIEPGQHSYFIVSNSYGEGWRVNAEAGRAYVVEVNPFYLRAVYRNVEEGHAEQVERLLRASQLSYPDGPSGPEWVRTHRSAIQTAMHNTGRKWGELGQDQRRARSLRPQDGFVGFDVQVAAPPASGGGFQLAP